MEDESFPKIRYSYNNNTSEVSLIYLVFLYLQEEEEEDPELFIEYIPIDDKKYP